MEGKIFKGVEKMNVSFAFFIWNMSGINGENLV